MKAQISIFIIIGLILLIVVAIIYYVASLSDPINSPNQDSLRTYMDTCLQAQTENGVHLLGMFSGSMTETGEIKTIAESEILLKDYTEQKALECLDSYPNDEQINITANEPKADVTLADTIIVKLDNVYSFTSGQVARSSESFDFQLSIRYKTVRDAAKQIVDERGDYIKDSVALRTAGFDVEAALYEDMELWMITDKISRLKGVHFISLLLSHNKVIYSVGL